MDKVKRIILTIPSPEWDSLRFLMIFLKKVARKSELNKMHAKNLATVMAPNILYRKPEEDVQNALFSFQSSKEMGPAIEIITVLIQEVEFFFFAKDNQVESKIDIQNEEKEG